ncbi:type II secretion system F family protein [Nocardioides jishulii]|uniref:Type II secretion system protein n=1 Tax=Nocardioides jishulii TaxID=2575440 RepID=A0A4V5TL00_9ACTN|nr:type II secretion system F family protein [Nocardioides jishulii]QCX28781.1 type II secretion system protein [Nocardioides jishulii]TKI64323.1 type II secretion system protein [Nocardioides jishulii]
MSGIAGWVAAVALGCAVLLVRPVRPVGSRPRRITWQLPRRARAERLARSARAGEACSVLAEELRVGRDPGSALRWASEVCPELGPVVQAYDLGADVPAALRRTGVVPLARIAGAWQVAHRSGQGLADALEAVAEELRREAATRRVVSAELASARATARMLVGLPVLALVVVTWSGAEPWRFFLGGVGGALCGLAGLALMAAGLVWIERIADAVEARA